MVSRLVVVFFSLSLLLVGCVQQAVGQRGVVGLGDLCSGSQCTDYCRVYSRECEEYCIAHAENAMCRERFSFVYEKDYVPFWESGESQPVQSGQNNAPSTPARDCVSNAAPLFTRGFTDASMLLDITPIGSVRGGSPGRSYVAVQRNNGVFEKVPIYAPVDAVLKGVAFAYRNYGERGSRAEYRLDFQVSCEVSITLDHIAEVTDKIRAVAPAVAANNTRNDREVSLGVAAGELLGYTDGTLVAGTFDFMVLNTNFTASYVNPARWQSEQLLHATCPYDYFVPELKREYYALLLTKDAQGNGDCGRVSNDVAGSMAGGWFKGNATYWSGLRLIAATEGDYVDVKIVDYATGVTTALVSHFKAPLKPEETKVGDSVCYSDNTNFVFLKLVSSDALESAVGIGACPSSMPTQTESWER